MPQAPKFVQIAIESTPAGGYLYALDEHGKTWRLSVPARNDTRNTIGMGFWQPLSDQAEPRS